MSANLTLNPGSSDSFKVGSTTTTSVGDCPAAGAPPSHTPETVAIPETVKLVPPAPISVTWLNVGVFFPKIP